MLDQIDTAWFECLLQGQAKEKSKQKVVNVTIQEGVVPKGENYGSKIIKIKLDIVDGSGRKSKKSLITKIPAKKENGDDIIDLPIFKTEIKVYKDILSQFDAVMNELEDPNDKLWCDLFAHKNNDVIMLEDLTVKNFRVHERRTPLDMNHALLVLNSLGRFHGISHVLLQRNILKKDDLDKHLMGMETTTSVRLSQGGFGQLAHVMETFWPPEWKEIAEKLKAESKVVDAKIRKIFEFPEDGFLVLNHGDCWTCNFMFKYSPYDGTLPIAFKFVDFQISHFNSFILDVMLFLHVSVNPHVRREFMDKLLLEYHKSLTTTLEFYGMGDKAPTLDHVYAEAKRATYASLYSLTVFFAIVTNERNDGINMENLMSDCDPKNIYSPECFKSEAFRRAIEPDIKKWIRDGSLM